MARKSVTEKWHPPSAYAQERAMSALARAKHRLLTEDPEIAADSRLLQDMLEGETDDCMEVIYAMMRAATVAKHMHDMAETIRKQQQQRENRYANRYVTLKTAVFEAMTELGLPRIELPDVTARRQAGRKSVMVYDEDALEKACPYLMKVIKEPKKTEIGVLLEAGDEVPGATLSNGPDIIVITSG